MMREPFNKLSHFGGMFLCLFLSACTFHKEPAHEPITIEVAVFEGGYGIEWHKQVARQYERLHPGIRIHLWGDPRVDEKIKPRILRRDPPDLANCILPVWKLIVAGKLYPLDEALDSKAYGQDCTWRQALIPGVLANYQYNGKTYAMPSNFGIWVAWYDRRMFRRHGWKVPRTWGEFTRLCANIKAAGIAPIAFQGKYPTYAWATLLSLYQRLVPFDRWYAIQDLKPGAFLDPEFVHAARLLQQMAVNYFEPGAMAMTHTEAQLEWCNGRAAIVFCGLWLKNEMKNALPAGFQMDCFPIPPVEGGRGDPRAIYGGGAEDFYVFRDGRHPREALDFLKYMVSMITAPSYDLQLDTLSPIRGSTRGIPISDDLRSAVQIEERATRNFDDRLSTLYLDFARNAMPAHLAALLEARITPEEFARRMEAEAAAIRSNPDIYKPPARGVPKL
jgi:N-acetylglucosamine transport system substrate-binding protein